MSLRRAWWWALDYAYAGYWQVRSAVALRSPRRYLTGHLRPVIVIPGIYESWQFMRPLIDALHGAGHPVHIVTLLQHNRLPVRKAAVIVADYVSRQNLRDAAIVAHSKGGLIGKLAMLETDPDARIASMVAICTPFSGSRYAKFMLLPSLRAFSPHDETTGMLTREVAINARVTSIFGEFDPHIPEGSVLPGGRNIRLPIGGHFRILSDPRTIQTVLAAVGS